jgi:16S rRNA (cytosine967-C5)-methyltransferase
MILETVRRRNFLDRIINCFLAPSSISDLDPAVRAYLRLYVYQMKTKGPDNYEMAINVARVGRSLLGWRNLEEIEELLGLLASSKPEEIFKDLSYEEKLSLKVFLPIWFLNYCIKLFGRHEALQYLLSTMKGLPTYIRINTLKAAESELLREIGSEGVDVEKVDGLSHSYKVVGKKAPIVRTSSFRNGFFVIQDKASCLATEVADPQPGMTVLDVCAAPGVKTTHLAQLMENRGEIYSIDYSRRRMRIWKGEIGRMNSRISQPIIGDGVFSLPFQNITADVVILDPPCTSTGGFSRVPSAKWRLTSRSIRNMAVIQWKMLNHCAEFVKEGGHMVYSTCSITVEENESLIERFLRLNPDFQLDDMSPRIGLPGLRGQNLSQRLYPHLHECNGFFIANLVNQG